MVLLIEKSPHLFQIKDLQRRMCGVHPQIFGKRPIYQSETIVGRVYSHQREDPSGVKERLTRNAKIPATKGVFLLYAAIDHDGVVLIDDFLKKEKRLGLGRAWK